MFCKINRFKTANDLGIIVAYSPSYDDEVICDIAGRRYIMRSAQMLSAKETPEKLKVRVNVATAQQQKDYGVARNILPSELRLEIGRYVGEGLAVLGIDCEIDGTGP